jgi:hypothetical protein
MDSWRASHAFPLNTIQMTLRRVTSRKVVGLFPEQFGFEFVPVLHRLQGRFAAQG